AYLGRLRPFMSRRGAAGEGYGGQEPEPSRAPNAEGESAESSQTMLLARTGTILKYANLTRWLRGVAETALQDAGWRAIMGTHQGLQSRQSVLPSPPHTSAGGTREQPLQQRTTTTVKTGVGYERELSR